MTDIINTINTLIKTVIEQGSSNDIRDLQQLLARKNILFNEYFLTIKPKASIYEHD